MRVAFLLLAFVALASLVALTSCHLPKEEKLQENKLEKNKLPDSIASVATPRLGENAKTLKLGAMLPLTGERSDLGIKSKRAIELAVEEENSKGGIKGFAVELVLQDDGCSKEWARRAIANLLSSSVFAIVGPLCESALEEVLPIAEEKGVALITPSAKGVSLPLRGVAFRTSNSDAEVGKRIAEFIKNKGIERAAIVYSPTLNEKEIAKAFLERAKQFSELQIIETEIRDENSLHSSLEKLKRERPEAIVLALKREDYPSALRKAFTLKIASMLIAVENALHQSILNTGGAAENLLVFVNDAFIDERFMNSYNSKYFESPGIEGAEAYDATMAALLALRKASSIEEIPEKLREMKFEGASGNIDFDENGEVHKRLAIYRVSKGRFVKQVNP